jgi:hypothetical protein
MPTGSLVGCLIADLPETGHRAPPNSAYPLAQPRWRARPGQRKRAANNGQLRQMHFGIYLGSGAGCHVKSQEIGDALYSGLT